MPRPGAWMEGLKKALAFPMYATAAWLAWVYAQSAGSGPLARLFAAAVLTGLTLANVQQILSRSLRRLRSLLESPEGERPGRVP